MTGLLLASWRVRTTLLARRLARPPSREDRRLGSALSPLIGPPFKGDGRVRNERCRGMTGLLLASWRVRSTLLARRLARPPSREDRRLGSALSPVIGPPIKGDGRVRNERCRGMTRSRTADSLAATLLARRLARPPSGRDRCKDLRH
jgi:hypothetical protein